MIKAVIFDLDGTLINTLDDLGNATNYAMKKLGFPTHEMAKYRYFVGNGMRKLVERALPEDKRSEKQIDNALSVFKTYYDEHSFDKTCVYKGIETALDDLNKQGIKTAVLTNKADDSANAIVKRFFGDKFDCVTGQKSGVPTKPEPTSTLNTMKELGVSPNECVFVGDSCVDMQTACNSSCFPIGVLWGFRERQELLENGAKLLASVPNDIVLAVKELNK